MQFMLNQPFEEFLARLFCQFITTTNSIDTKYHFVSSNPTQSLQLYNGFKNLHFKTITVDESDLNYIETDNGKKVIVMLHHLGEQDRQSSHEDYIAGIRDALNNIDDAILFVIHNSSLETITSTCTDVSAKSNVFTPLCVNAALENLGVGLSDELIFKYLITDNEKKIKEENLSIFGYETLYKSIQTKTINLNDHGLFSEPRLTDIQHEKELSKELDRNSRLSKRISSLVNDFGDDPSELQRQLEDVGFSERFIKEQFTGHNKNEYKNRNFNEIETEIEKNKERSLDIVEFEVNGKKTEQWKRLSEVGSSRKNISLVGEVPPHDIELKIKMTRGEPQLKKDQISILGDLKLNQMIIGTSNHDIHSTINIKIPFSGKTTFVQLKLKRPSQRECFQLNFCFVEKENFYIENYFEKSEVEIKRNKGKLILENINDKIRLNPENSDCYKVSNTDTLINCNDIAAIDFSGMGDEDILGDFELVANQHILPITLAGTKNIESIKLPSLFDINRASDLFDIEKNAKYKSSNSRIIINGREKELSPKAASLCIDEYRLISEGILYLDDLPENTLYLNDIKGDFPKVALAYSNIYSWLLEHDTLLSITNWPSELVELLDVALISLRTELELIPQEALSKSTRNLLRIGMIKRDSQELFTPFHPISMSYAFEFVKLRVLDTQNSFNQVPQTTIDKFNAGGLLPILFDDKSSFVSTQAMSNNKLWLEVIPQKDAGNNYISTLVHEKIQDFVTCFDMLFQQSSTAPLIINSINNQSNIHIFKGIVKYLKKSKFKAKKIQVNIYDEDYHFTEFEKFSESRKIEVLRELVRLTSSDKDEILDDLIFRLRSFVSFNKVRNFDNYDYAHVSFFKNNEEVILRSNNVTKGKSGIVCNGILSGEASYLENDVFYTGFGLKNIETRGNIVVSIASLYNQLLFAYRDTSAKYIKDNVPVLAVKDTFRDKLSKSYDSSLWTCIIEPKVTLEFFNTEETILIHYTDQYTNSVAYDSITVSSRVGLYKDLLQSQSDELINSFNALNGQWLLSIVKESGKKKTSNTKKQIKEKQGIVAAYKFLSSLLLSSDLTWIPLSVGEMLRVTGNLGLEIKDNDFAARLHNKSKGALSDDILFVGIKGEQLVLLPLEVKTRKKGTDFTKAVKQAKALADHMKRLLEPKTFKGKVYRSLFIQQVLTQVDKFKLYKVFPDNYFESLIGNSDKNIQGNSDILLQGDYDICDLSNYPEGVALAVNEGMERSRIESELDKEVNVLKVRLPQGIVTMLHEKSISELSERFKDQSVYPEVIKLNLLKSELVTYTIKDLPEENVLVKSDITIKGITPPTCNIDGIVANNCDESINSSIEYKQFTAQFAYPATLTDLVNKLINLHQKDISVKDVLSLTEHDLNGAEGFESSDTLSFYRLKDSLINNTEQTQIESVELNDTSPKLNTINVTNEFKALVNTLLNEFGNELTVAAVLNISVSSLENINGFGKGKVSKFFKFSDHLKQDLFSINHQEDSLQQIDDFDLPLDELEEHLIKDLETYFYQEESRDINILSRRLGVRCKSETLEEIGQSHEITRERVRQLESRAKKNFIAKLSISPKVIWAITKSNLSELRAPLFATLRNNFPTDKNFYSFLEVCCDLKENEIKKITAPALNKSIFEEFWVWNKSPASIEDLSWYLHENMNIELAVAENQIAIWINDGFIQKVGDEVKPLLLSKVPGITHALLDFPNGDSWQNIQNHANTKNITVGDFFTDRAEPSLGYGADKEYLYQSGRGTYRHISYLNISETDKERILSIVLSKLNELKHEGRESVNLSVDIYQRLGLADDYYIVRHIIRAFGESVGIYFNGKSGADTISLASNFSLASQKSVLIDLFKKSLKPLSKKYVATKIRSQTLGHAGFYLDKLLTEGEIVRIDEMHYAHVENAFVDIDIETTLSLAFSYIDKEDRIIEGEKIQTHLNRHLDADFNKYLYIALLKSHAEASGKKYHYVHNLVSNSIIEYSSLSEICREAQKNTPNNVEAKAYVDSRLCIHEHVLKRCFHQVSTSNQLIDNSPVKDVLEEPIEDEKTQEDVVPQMLTKKSSIESCRILIGKALDNQEEVYWEYGNIELGNRHLIIFGGSGQGKTYCIQGLLIEMAKASCNSLIIDYTNGFLPNRLEDEFNDFVKPKSHFLAQKPLGISPFRKQKQDFGGVILEEQNHIVAGRISSVFNQVYSSIGEQQLATLMNVLEDGVRRHNRQYDFDSMLDDLREEGKTGEALANKLSPMVKSKLFDSNSSQSWESIFKDERSYTNIIQLASLSRDIMQLATEFTLWDLYAYACSYGDKKNPLPIVLDEVQNLDHKLDSPVSKMLTEGRKYGLSLILATQTLSMLSKDEQDRLFQADHKLFFSPADTEIQSYAKLLEQSIPGTSRKAWLDELAKLKKGECISVGLHMNSNGAVEQGARVVRVSALAERI